MHFKQYLATTAQEVDEHIARFFEKWTRDIATVSPHLVPLINAFSLATSSGKRIRGSLVKLGYQLASDNDTIPDEIFTIAVAYEIFQTAILAHDDIIDKSSTRRGKPTLYKQLGRGHYGISQTICLGDIGFFLAFHLITATPLSDVIKSKTLAFFSKAMLDTGIGELLDVELAQNKKQISEEDILTIYRFKTAYYTLVAPLSLGAIIAGGSQQLLDGISQYGEHIGITYQIQDDINDIFGNPQELKKEIGADITEGKNTLLFFKALEKATDEQKQILTKYYGNSLLTEESIAAIKEIFIATGALEYSLAQAEQHVQQAKHSIPQLTQDQNLQNMLYEITEFFVKKNI